jgi:hypothetical protein
MIEGSSCAPVGGEDGVERCAERSAGLPAAISAERSANCFRIGAILDRKTEGDCSIARVRVGGGIGFMIRQEQFADSAIRKSAKGRDIAQARDLDFEGLGEPSIWEALTSGR